MSSTSKTQRNRIFATLASLVLLFVYAFCGVKEAQATAGYVTGKFNKAYNFNGQFYVDAGNVGTGIKSAGFWVQGTSAGTVLDFNGSSYVSIAGGVVSATGFTATIYVDGVAGTAVDSNWHYVVVTTTDSIDASAVKFGSVGFNSLIGLMDDVKFYNYALSTREIYEKFMGGTSSLASGGTVDGSLYLMSSGYLGLGTTSPTSKLAVAGGIGIGSTAANSVYHSLAIAPDGGLIVEGNVGIGTTAPTGKLDIQGDEVRIWTGAGTNTNALASGELYVEGDLEVDGTLYTAGQTIAGNLLPATADQYNLGGTSNEWNALYLGDDAGVYFGADQNHHLYYDETTDDRLELVGSGFDLDLSGAFSLDSDSTLTLGGTRLIYTSDLAAGQTTTEAISLKSSVDLGVTDEVFQVGDTADMLTILGNGNVGIGTTNPDSKLHVVGGDLYVASDTPAFGNASANEDLYVAGNMEVDGQCVTGDTALPIARVQSSKCKVQSCSPKFKVEEIKYKPIKDIKGGEYVLSLNEETGKIEPHKIKGLLDMGVKPVFKLTTEDGRTIRTTGNHPYLVREQKGDSFVSGLLLGELGKEDKSQKQSDQAQSNTNINARGKISKIDHNPPKISSILTASAIDSVASKNDNVNTKMLVTVNGKINNPAPTLVKSADNTLSWEGRKETENFIERSVVGNKIDVNGGWLAMNPREASGSWTKVVYLKSGMEIAVSDGQIVAWQKITSIEPVGYEQVYDIEVEGTHNFVANGIVAHNTYLAAVTSAGNLLPATADTYDLGSTTAEWNALYLGDDAGLYLGNDQDFSLLYDETTHDRLELTGTAFDIALSGAYSLDSASTITMGSTRLLYTSDYAAGNGALEAISLKSSVDLGATDQLFEVGDGGGDFLTILGNGNVGIGTTTPSTLLSIAGVSGTDLFSIANTTGVTQLGVKYATSDGVYLDMPSTEPTNRASNGTFESDLSGWVASNTLTLQPDGTDGLDTQLRASASPDSNYGTNTGWFTYSPPSSLAYREVAKFNLTSIPSGATITTATLTLTLYSASGNDTFAIARILAANPAWTETSATWNHAVATTTRWAGDAGADGGADAGCSVAGTDYSSTPLYSGTPGLTLGAQNFTLNTTEFALMAANNYGFVHFTDSATANVFRLYRSSDYATAEERPKLVVDYSSATRDTSIKYSGTASVKVVGLYNLTQSLNVGDTGAYNLVGYAYTDGTAVTSADAELYYNGATITTTYTSVGGGWYKLQGSVTGANEARNYGIQVKAGKTVYFDNFSVQSGLAGDRTLYVQNSGTGFAKLNVESTSTLNAGTAANQALIVKGAASQTANLTEWQNSSGTVLSVIDENGYLGIGTTNPASAMQLVGNLTLGGSGVAASKIINATVGLTAGGASVDESTSNLFSNASFEHSTFSTSWSTGFNYDATATTFTPLMAKRNAPGPFTAAPILQGDWATEGGDSDTLTFAQGTVISGNFYPNFDSNQGSMTMWVTPEWAGNDGITHYLFEGSTNFLLYKNTSNNLVFSTASGVSISKDISAWVAGTTYGVVVRWDSQNTLDGTNYLSITVDDGTATVGRTTVYTPEAPAATLYIGSTSTGTNPANAIIEGLAIYRRPLWDGTTGINAGNGDEVAKMIGVGGTDPTLATGSWDVVFNLPTNSTAGALATGTGEAWSHPHASSILTDSYAQTTYGSSAWATSGTPSTGPADMVSTERVYLGGYKWTADAADEGITQTKGSLTAGANYVVRAVAHSSSADAVRVVIYDVTNSATITSFDFGGSSTRQAPGVGIFAFELPTIARNGSAANCTSIAVRVLSSAASQTVYLHQIEVQPNMFDNPSFETGAGPDPWIPSGWTNQELDSGEGVQETGIGNFHSGSSSFKQVSATSQIESLYQSFNVTSGKYFLIGGFGDGMNQWSGNIYISQSTLGTALVFNAARWNPFYGVARSSGTLGGIGTNYSFVGTKYYDDFYSFQLSDVSLTATSANTLKSTEASGIRVDGRDTLSQAITNITTTTGRIRFKYTPRHTAADASKFDEASDDAYVATFWGSASNYIKLFWDTASTLKMEYNINGGGAVSGTSASTGMVAGTTYDMDLAYTGGGSMILSVNGVATITLATIPAAFGTTPTVVKWGSSWDATTAAYQGDATFGAPTAMTASTTTTYLGNKSAYVDATADSSRYSRELTQTVDPNSTATHTLSAYVKMSDASAVTSSKVKFIWEGAIVTPTAYTALANNWYRVTYSAATTDASNSYGVYVYAGYAAYVDGMQLEAKAYATSFAESTRTAGSLISDNDLVGRSLFLYGDSTFYGDLLPGYSNAFDLGSTTNTWKSLYLSGNVGIGTTGPSGLLELDSETSATNTVMFEVTSDVTTDENIVFQILANGNFEYDGTGSSPASDVAEMYSAAEGEVLEPGTVVSLAVNPEAYVAAAAKPYDDQILGVVSTKPALLMSADTPNGVAVALLGKVPTKVSLENGAIRKGDFLTSSSVPGYAMKACSSDGRDTIAPLQGDGSNVAAPSYGASAACRPGMVIGRALQDFDGTEDGIEFVELPEASVETFDRGRDRVSPLHEPGTESTESAVLAEASSSASPTTTYNLPPTTSSKVPAKKILVMVNVSWYGGGSNGESRITNTATGLGINDDISVETIAKSLTINQNLTVLGATSLNHLSVASSSLFGGNLLINELGDSIGTLTGDLKLQPLARGNLDIFNGKVVFTTDGSLHLTAGVLYGNDEMRGQISLEIGKTRVVVARNWKEIPVTVTLTPSYETKVWVTDISKDGFTVNVSSAPAQEEKVYWLAIW